MIYTWKDKHKGRYLVKKRLGGYKRGQQGCTVTQRRTMEKENHSRNNNIEVKQCTRENRSDEGNTTEWNQRKRSDLGIIERR